MTTTDTAFDQHAINDMTVAVRIEMLPTGRRAPECDTLFMGAAEPTENDQRALANFGLSKNYNVILPAFDPANPAAGPVGFHVVVTDGATQSTLVSGGRLWKRDRRTPSILLFADTGMVVRMSAKGRLVVGPARGRRDEQGFELARDALVAQAARKPGRGAVVSPIGGMVTVLDMRALADSFALAA